VIMFLSNFDFGVDDDDDDDEELRKVVPATWSWICTDRLQNLYIPSSLTALNVISWLTSIWQACGKDDDSGDSGKSDDAGFEYDDDDEEDFDDDDDEEEEEEPSSCFVSNDMIID